MNDAERWTVLRGLLGYVEDGSSETVTICQDDATRDWVVKVGKRTFHDRSLDAALKAASA